MKVKPTVAALMAGSFVGAFYLGSLPVLAQDSNQSAMEREGRQIVVEEGVPQVSVDQPQPKVYAREGVTDGQGRQDLAQLQVQQDRQMAPQDMGRGQPDQQHRGQAQVGSDLYTLSIADIRAARVLDSQGNAIGGVEEVIVKNDGSDAGLIVRTGSIEGQGQLVYIPLAAVSLENDQLILDQQRLMEEADNADDFNPQDYAAVPESDRSLNEFIGEEELTQR